MMERGFLFLVIVCALFCGSHGACDLTGVNLSGGEFDSGSIPGKYGTKYIYPPTKNVDYFIPFGMNVFRIPFQAARIQKYPGGFLVQSELDRIDPLITYITQTKGKYVLLDPHGYGGMFGGKVGESQSPISVFADFWAKVATYYKSNPKVIFGLMNEPNGQSPSIWWQAAQAAVDSIRNAGATQLILVPGVSYTGAHSWISSKNSLWMYNVTDPVNNMAFEVHQYFDSDSSGTHPECVSATIGSKRVTAFTEWARARKVKGFLGEFGASGNDLCLQALKDVLGYMDANSDVWLGWTYWAGGPWYGDKYVFNLQANSTGKPRNQMASVSPYITKKNITLPIPKAPTSVPGVIEISTSETAMFDDSLHGFTDSSWGPHSTKETKVVHSGVNSISFTPPAYGALWFKCSGAACLDTTKTGQYLTLDFWFNPGNDTSNTGKLNFYMINGSSKVGSASMSVALEHAPAANEWVKGHVLFTGFPDGVYSGIQIANNNDKGFTTPAYIDDITFVEYSDNTPIVPVPGATKKPTTKPNPTPVPATRPPKTTTGASTGPVTGSDSSSESSYASQSLSADSRDSQEDSRSSDSSESSDDTSTTSATTTPATSAASSTAASSTTAVADVKSSGVALGSSALVLVLASAILLA